MDTLKTRFKDIIKEVMARSTSSTKVTEDNVFQEGNNEILPFLDMMAEDLLLPGSGLDGFENLEDLYSKAEAGKSCLLLLEHYSNMDLTNFSYLVRRAGGRGEEIGRSVIAIAGMKLNEDHPAVSAFASAYTRIVIYPSRSLLGLDREADRAEIVRSNGINRAAMKALLGIRNKGRLILCFPSGTRFRPWDPSTKRGVAEIDSYIRSFDYMCLVAVNGNVLHVHRGEMLDDPTHKDLVRLTVSPVLSCTEFRDRARAAGADAEDKKQVVADALMAELEVMHEEAEERRQKLIAQGS